MVDIATVVDIVESVDTVDIMDIVDIMQLCAAVVQPRTRTAVMQPRADIM